jgi:hypothetical protein
MLFRLTLAEWQHGALEPFPMRRGGFLRWVAWLAPDTSVRHPHPLTAAVASRAIDESQLLADAETLRQITLGLDELHERAANTEIIQAGEARGYLTPEEDDRVRRGLLAYRNYRLALYAIILRLERYPRVTPATLRVKAFLVAFAAALTLYSQSLRLEELAARSDLVRAKLNEPEPKFDLEEGARGGSLALAGAAGHSRTA